MSGIAPPCQLRPRRERGTMRLLAHSILILGCLVFGFPFYWLLSTSVKEQEELFADPPVWVPAWPPCIVKSPYFARDEYRVPKPPQGVDAEEWSRQWPELRRAAVTLVRTIYLIPQAIKAPLNPVGEEALARGVYHVISARLSSRAARQLLASPSSPSQNTRPAYDILSRYVTDRDCKTVWENVHRALLIRGITIQDQGFVQYRLGDDDPTSQWRVTSGEAQIEPAQLGRKSAVLIRYSFSRHPRFTLETELDSPMPPGQFRRLTIPVRGDKSWHRVALEVDVGGRLFHSTEPLILFSDLSQEAAWQIPDKERAGASAFRDYLPLKEAGKGSCARQRVHVKLTFIRNGFWQVGWAKARRNYRDALDFVPMGTYFRNTLLLVLLNVLGHLFSCSVVAYAFARLRWPGRDACFAVLLATMMLPAQVTMIPVFLIYRYLGWYGTLQPLWVGSFFGSAFFIFLLRQFMRAIPRDLEDAAKIDGCSFFGIYWRIIMPLMKPALAAVAIFSFMYAWNEFMGPLIYLNDQRLYPLSLGLYQFRIERASEYGMLMASSALMIVPVVIVFFLAQKHFIQGVQFTGIRG